MPKNEGGWIQKKVKESCSTNLEPQDTTPTYKELGIDKKDASEWQKMADNEGIGVYPSCLI